MHLRREALQGDSYEPAETDEETWVGQTQRQRMHPQRVWDPLLRTSFAEKHALRQKPTLASRGRHCEAEAHEQATAGRSGHGRGYWHVDAASHRNLEVD